MEQLPMHVKHYALQIRELRRQELLRRYEYLISYPDRATEMAIVATQLQDASVQRLDAAPQPQAAPADDAADDADSYWIDPLDQTGPRTPGQRIRRKRRRA